MTTMKPALGSPPIAVENLQSENEELRRRLEEAEETIRAIQSGTVDALVIEEPAGNRIYTLDGADRPYRLLVEKMQQGAATLQADGTIAYCNMHLADLLKAPQEKLIGAALRDFIADEDHPAYDNLLWQGQRRSGQGEARLRRADGGLVPTYLTFNALPKDCGAAIGALITDLTAQKHQEQLAAAHEALRESVERYRKLTSVLTDVPWTTDSEGQFVTPQDAYSRYTGKSWDELRGFGWTQCIHSDDREQLVRIWKQAVATRTTYHAPCRQWHGPTQRWRHVIARGTPVLNADGSVREWVGSLTDVEEQHRAEQALRDSEQRFRHMADAVPVLIWVSDTSKACTWFNKGWLDFSGRAMQELVGDGWAKDVHPDDLVRCLQQYNTHFDARQPFWMEYRLRRNDGEYRWFVDNGVPRFNSDGEFVGYIGSCVDFTERIRMEKALRDGDQRKDEFLAMLAHELRNPLAPIRNSLNVLQLMSPGDPTVEQVGQMMERQVNHMVRLVDDLLEVSRITRGKIELRLELVELAGIVRTAVETSQPLITAAGHQLAVSLPAEPLSVNADPIRLSQIISNLLNNSAKYTEAGGQIWLTIRREGEAVAISVRDSGIGIAPEMLPNVFQLFAQVDRHTSRAQGGLGIGLTLVKNLTEMHGGEVRAHSPGLGQGSEFVIRLPLAAEPTGSNIPRVGDRPHSELAPRRILVVDDNRDAATSMSMLLKHLGSEVRVAFSGEEALQALSEFKPAVVLLDIGMPVMDGYEVARRIRKQSGCDDVTLIALTGWGQEDDRRRTQAAGFDHHLTKPADIRSLEELLVSLPSRN